MKVQSVSLQQYDFFAFIGQARKKCGIINGIEIKVSKNLPGTLIITITGDKGVETFYTNNTFFIEK